MCSVPGVRALWEDCLRPSQVNSSSRQMAHAFETVNARE